MYSVTTPGEAKRSSHRLNQTHTRQDPNEKRTGNRGQRGSTSDSPDRAEGQTRQAEAERPAGVQCPSWRARRGQQGRASRAEHPGMPERHRARRQHRRSRQPRVAAAPAAAPSAALPSRTAPSRGTAGQLPLGSAGLGCGELRAASGAPAARPRLAAAVPGRFSRLSAPPSLLPARSPSLPARWSPGLAPRTQAGTPRAEPSRAGDSGPFPLTSSGARREPAPAEAGRTVAVGRDGGTGAGSRGSRARAGANCAKRRPLLQRVHASRALPLAAGARPARGAT